jgi:Ni/Co efflux regulator RcnB
MKLVNLLVLILGLAALAFAVKYALQDTTAQGSAAAASRPKRQLDNVRSRAKELEREQQRQADDIAKKAGEGN